MMKHFPRVLLLICCRKILIIPVIAGGWDHILKAAGN